MRVEIAKNGILSPSYNMVLNKHARSPTVSEVLTMLITTNNVVQ